MTDRTIAENRQPMPIGTVVRRARKEKGAALIITLLLLSLVTVIGLVMVLSVTADMLINGFYRNHRGSFYAADSGLNVARQQLLNQVSAGLPTVWATPPVANPAALATTAQTYVTTNYASSTSLNAGQAANSWSEKFSIPSATLTLAAGYPVITQSDPVAHIPTGYKYVYNYSITSNGTSSGSEQAAVSEIGSFNFDITGSSGNANISFAAYGTFIDQYAPCSSPFGYGTMSGPMFTNGAWQFGSGGSYIFTDTVGQHETNASFWFGNSCIQSPASSYKSGNTTIKPTFNGGYNRGQPTAALPANEFQQKWAVLSGDGSEGADPTSAQMTAALKKLNGTAYSGSTGVYLPYSITSGGSAHNQLNGGGIYVEGDATVTLAPVAASSTAETYTIIQSGTTTTVTVDPSATPPSGWNCPVGTTGTTVFKSGATTTNICNVPRNYGPTGGSAPATMIFVNGAITSLKGTNGQGTAAVQDHTAVTITAHGDISVTGDILYKTKPVNMIPESTLIAGNDNGQVLGIFTNNGNVNLANAQSNHNLEIDASIATIKQGGTGGIVMPNNNCTSTLNILGGRINNQGYGTTCTFTRNLYFDRRFADPSGFAPPWFPATTVQLGGAQPINIVPTVQRVRWTNQTAFQ